jgi:hypothetical protein
MKGQSHAHYIRDDTAPEIEEAFEEIAEGRLHAGK